MGDAHFYSSCLILIRCDVLPPRCVRATRAFVQERPDEVPLSYNHHVIGISVFFMPHDEDDEDKDGDENEDDDNKNQ